MSTQNDPEPLTASGGSGTALAAPQWLIDRMDALKKLPPPTLEEVQACFDASAKARAHFDATGEWPNNGGER